MSSAVMISIKPKWCEKIIAGEKTIEVRKTRPNQETPFKVYIYCTAGTGKNTLNIPISNKRLMDDYIETGSMKSMSCPIGNCKIIGEFICDRIDHFDSDFDEWAHMVAPPGSQFEGLSWNRFLTLCKEEGRLSDEDINLYWPDGVDAYLWHISELKIYDDPKDLEQFRPICSYRDGDSGCQFWQVKCSHQHYNFNPDGSVSIAGCIKRVTKAPQSWQYVEEV